MPYTYEKKYTVCPTSIFDILSVIGSSEYHTQMIQHNCDLLEREAQIWASQSVASKAEKVYSRSTQNKFLSDILTEKGFHILLQIKKVPALFRNSIVEFNLPLSNIHASNFNTMVTTGLRKALQLFNEYDPSFISMKGSLIYLHNPLNTEIFEIYSCVDDFKTEIALLEMDDLDFNNFEENTNTAAEQQTNNSLRR